MKTLLTIGLLSFIAAPLAFADGMADCSKDSHYPLITKSELKSVSDSKSAFIVDVNGDDSYNKVHVPTAVHFTKAEEFASQLPADKSTLIVAYCGGVKCEAWKKAAQAACEKGYTNVKHYKEGISGWTHGG